MKPIRISVVMALRVCTLLFLPCGMAGCGSTEATVAGVTGTTIIGSSVPGQEIEQIYYLGVFDPREQTPSTIFRLTIHGQASALSGVRFAGGWVPAEVADSLNGNLSFQNDKIVGPSAEERKTLGGIETGRRLILFGPEGFREAPRSQRLVLVMGSSPEKYFAAVSRTLDGLAQIRVDRLDAQANQTIIEKLRSIREERLALETLREEVLREPPAAQGGI